jgi:hemoglobin
MGLVHSLFTKERTMTRMTRWGMTTVLTAVLVVAVVDVASAQDKPMPLYDRLGGVYSIATVVDEFVERLLVNQTLNANPAINQARSRVPKAGLKFHVTALVCAATGGPCSYTGRSMRESHQQLNITEGQWQAMVSEFRKTLDKFKVPAKEQGELITIVNSTKTDIVAPATSQR